MNAKHLLAMLTLATAVGCNSIQRSSFDSFDEYPVYEGKWEEMTYSPAGTHFFFVGSYSSGSTCHVIRKGQGGAVQRMISMQQAADGMWQAVAEGDLKGSFYAFQM